MKGFLVFLLLLVGGLVQAPRAGQEVRFAHVDVFVDGGARALAAWQVELSDPSGRAKVVGVEGGATAPWTAPPRYDPAALQGGRIVLAAFTLEDAHAGRQHVARLHLAIDGDAPVAFELGEIVVADPEGGRFEGALVEIEE